MELEAQLRRDVGVAMLLVWQVDVETHIGCTRIMRAAIGGFHDAGATARADVKALTGFLLHAFGRHDAGERTRGFIALGVAQTTLSQGYALGIATGSGLCELLLRLIHVHEAGAAIDHDSVLYAALDLGQVGLEHFQLHADATGFAAEHEFRVGEGEAVGLRL